ncbi:hypothetical protein D8X55_01025 [Malacoplasma penetrans]|nr:hypothetical protein D8X55_01025 [Malacoplasma penetrans]
MLVQLRKVCSEKLNQQTIGRIKRNPRSDLKKDDLYLDYWIYSSHQEKTREIHNYKLQEKFENTNFPSIIVTSKTKNENKEMNLKFWSEEAFEYIKKQEKDFIFYWKDFFVNNKDNFISVKSIIYGSDDKKNSIFREKLFNILDINMFIFKIFKKYHWLNKRELEKIYLKLFYTHDMDYTQFLFIFCNLFVEELNIKRNKYLSNTDRKYEINYFNTLPKQFIVYEGENNKVNIKDIEGIYAYKNISYDKKDNDFQFLDSMPENVFLTFIKKEIIFRNLENKIELLAKNPLQSTIYCEYWKASESKYCKAYIDFILKVKNKNEFVFIEIKSLDFDYDERKTESIINELKCYENSINSSTMDIHLAVIPIGKNQKILSKNYEMVHIKNKNSSQSNKTNYKSITDFLDYLEMIN